MLYLEKCFYTSVCVIDFDSMPFEYLHMFFFKKKPPNIKSFTNYKKLIQDLSIMKLADSQACATGPFE